MAKTDLTARRLRELLDYHPETGLFRWQFARGQCAAGAVAGSMDDSGYVVIRVDWSIYKAGRLAWLYTYGKWPLKKIHYLDLDRSNNRIENLIDAAAGPRKLRPEMSAELLRGLIRYEPNTGLFYRASNGTQFIGDCSGRYVRMTINGRRYQAHRLAWLYVNGVWPENEIDHVDRIKHNNIWTNLREATTKQNQENITPRLGTSSGVTGVSWMKSQQCWHVTLMNFKKRIFIGHFKSLADAIEARTQAEKKFFTHSTACKLSFEGPCFPSPPDGIS